MVQKLNAVFERFVVAAEIVLRTFIRSGPQAACGISHFCVSSSYVTRASALSNTCGASPVIRVCVYASTVPVSKLVTDVIIVNNTANGVSEL